MIRSQEIALRCAEVMKKEMPQLLSGHHEDSPRLKMLRQLDDCKDDAARRLLLGRSR